MFITESGEGVAVGKAAYTKSSAGQPAARLIKVLDLIASARLWLMLFLNLRRSKWAKKKKNAPKP